MYAFTYIHIDYYICYCRSWIQSKKKRKSVRFKTISMWMDRKPQVWINFWLFIVYFLLLLCYLTIHSYIPLPCTLAFFYSSKNLKKKAFYRQAHASIHIDIVGCYYSSIVWLIGFCVCNPPDTKRSKCFWR